MTLHKLIFLLALVVSISTDAQLYNYSETICNSEPCKFLFEKLVEKSDPSYTCKDFQHKVCHWRNDYHGKYDYRGDFYLDRRDPKIIEFEKNTIKKLTENLMNYKGEYKSIYSERDLYDQCLKLGSPRGKNNVGGWLTSKRLSEMIDVKTMIGIDKWQKVDQQLFNLGFGHAFFDVKVVKDPSDTSRNIILVESPSAASLTAAKEIFSTHYLKIVRYTYNNRIFKERINSFFDSWIETANNTVERPYIQFPNSRMTLKEWNDKFNNRYDEHYVVDINWAGMLIEIFEKVNIKINDSTPIIVKNERTYFEKLYYLLRDTPNDVIAATIFYKTVAENLRSVNWEVFQLLNDTERSKFCFNNIKLYGITTHFLNRHISENKKYFEKLKRMAHNIVQSIRHEIERSSMSYAQEVYFLDELEDIVAGIHTNVQDDKYRYYVSEYYGNYYKSNNYFESLMNYRIMLKNKELSTLESDPKVKPKLFSITDSILASNRFFFYICFMMHEMSSNALPEDLPKQYYYGTYGSQIASFLYSLMNENKFENTEVNYSIKKSNDEILTTWPDFVRDMLICQNTSADIKMGNYVIERISEVFGLQLAYETMKHDTLLDLHDDLKKIVFPNNTGYNENQYFFLSYAASHCEEYKGIVNTALSSNTDFVRDFYCISEKIYYKYECNLTMFEPVNNRAFLIQL